MNCGLGNLTELKVQLLAKTMRASTDYDAVIAGIGKGVAVQFEKFCNRKFGYTVNDTYIVPADRDHVILPRYPVYALTLSERKDDTASDWETVTDLIQADDSQSGMIYFGGIQGTYWQKLRITYTAGYFFETLESGAEGYPSAVPTGVESVPDDLKHAWYLSCRNVWNLIDKLGKSITGESGGGTLAAQNLGYLDSIPEVKNTLNAYRRFQIT